MLSYLVLQRARHASCVSASACVPDCRVRIIAVRAVRHSTARRGCISKVGDDINFSIQERKCCFTSINNTNW